MPHAIRIHAPAVPKSCAGRRSPSAIRARRGARPPHGRRRQLHRHLSSQRPLQAAAAVAASASEAAGVVEAVGPRRRLGEAGRSRRLLRRPARLVQRSARDAGRAAGQAARRHLRIASAATLMLKGLTVQYLFRQTYKLKAGDTILFHAAAGGVGPHRLPVGARARRDDDRHRRVGREGGAREGERLHAHDRLHARELRRAREGADRRQGRAGGLRRRRQGHVSGVARLPVAARSLCATATRRGRFRRSTSCCCRRRARSM